MSNCFNKTADYWENVGIAFANILGLGTAIKNAFNLKTPADKIRDKISSLKEETTAFRNAANLQLWSGQEEFNSYLFRAISIGDNNLNESLILYRELLSEDISINKVYVFFLYIFFIIIFIFVFIRI